MSRTSPPLHSGFPTRTALLGLFLLLANCWPATASASDVLLGPVEELLVLDEFTAESEKTWQARGDRNVSFKLSSGQVVPGVADSLMQIEFARKDDAKPASFTLKRPLPPDAIGTDADGLRLLIGSPMGGQWWLRLSVHIGEESYSYVMQTAYPDRLIIEQVIPFESLKAGDRALDPARARSIDAVSLLVGAHDGTLYLDRLSTYRQEKFASWLSVTSAQPRHHIFQPGEAVKITFSPGGTLPADAKAFRYQVIDYFEKPVSGGTVLLDGSASYDLDVTPPVHGYYELRVYWLDEAGKDLENRSCIRADGSLPPGIATFAVMPRTVEQNVELIQRAGQGAFFGMHSDFMGLADYIGLTWRLGYHKWRAVETSRPDRSEGIAPWAKKILETEPPQPAYRFHFQPFTPNLAPPAWAKNPQQNVAPPYANWDDYLAWLRDSVKVEMHRYPHMNPRLYGVAWEINLNMPPHNFNPPYTPQDVVELHRRTRETIKAIDPSAMVLGPCPSNLNVKWFETIFEAGALQYVDAIETHGYAEGVFTPEEYDYPGKIAAINDLMRRHNDGKVLPIYITEAAFRGRLGSTIIHHTQAQVMTRLAIILKGEGVRCFMPFFSIDYDRDGWWGFLFNLEVDAPNPWGTQRVSPKPTVNAMATCVGLLEGATPVRRVRKLGPDVWAYLFDKDGKSILAIWTPQTPRRISVPAGDASTLRAVNIMGHESQLPAQDGQVDLTIDPSPQYLIDAPAALLH